MAKINIIYTSVGGNTELACQKIQALLIEAEHDCQMLNAKTVNPNKILPADLLIWASPTYGRGALEKFMANFFKKCEQNSNLNLEDQKCAIVGMGDATYESDYFGESAALTKAWLLKQKADVIHLPLMISQSPLPFFESYIPRWVTQLLEKFEA